MNFEARYADLAERILGRKLLPEDGVTEAAIRRREKELGQRLPAALRDYHRVAGKLSILNRMHNIIYELHEIWLEDEHLFFMEENQSVVHWCLRLSDLDCDDPQVRMRVNNDTPEWHSEELNTSAFIIDTLEWESGVDEQASEGGGTP